MRRVAIFDLDGTLIDSAPAIARALGRLRASRGLPGLERDFDPFLRFHGLMNARPPFAAFAQPAGEFIDDDNLAVADDVLPVEEHLAGHFDGSFDVFVNRREGHPVHRFGFSQLADAPAAGQASELSSRNASPRAAAMPWLLAAAKPRLRSLAISRTAGKRSRSSAGLPSVEALSTTMTSCATPAAETATDSSARASRSRVLKLAMMTLMSGVCCDVTAAPAAG